MNYLKASKKFVPKYKKQYFNQKFYSTTAPTLTFKNFDFEIKDSVAIVRFNTPDSKVNVLNLDTSTELLSIVNEINNNNNIKSAVIISKKSGCFVAGADIEMLSKCKTKEEATKIASEAQQMFHLISRSNKKYVAAINGSCLGGGMELALACHYRIAVESPKTVLGLPEVMLGLLPGAGGTQRLPQIVALPDSLDMILTGRNIRPFKAKRMGLIDQTVSQIGIGLSEPEPNTIRYLEEVAFEVAKGFAAGNKIKPRQKPLVEKITSLLKPVVFNMAAKGVEKKTLGNYPAPKKILQVLESTVGNGGTSGYDVESKAFGELAMTNESKALISIYFANNSLKKNRFGEPKKRASNVGILGAGLMGAGIAQVSIQKAKTKVMLKDTKWEGLARGKNQISENFTKDVQRKAMTNFDKNVILSSLSTQVDYSGFSKADIVIEAVFEDIDIKHKVLREVEGVVGDHCIFASNTSALPISEIAKASKRPEQVIGMHYFSPVDKMPLLEIIKTEKTSKEACSIATDLGIRQGKTVIIVNDGPGFYTTRILAPMLSEMFLLLKEGVEIERLDKVMKQFGFPVGPVTLADEVGIDVAAHIAKYLGEVFPSRMSIDMSLLDGMVSAGFHGKKNKKGFYDYNVQQNWYEKLPFMGGKKKVVNQKVAEMFKTENKKEISTEDIQHRLGFKMVNEAICCLEDGVLENPIDGDIGAIFGLGFPPFLGGPFRFADTFGAQRLSDRMNSLADKYGDQLRPSKLLLKHAKDQTKFHNN
eukprot:TRINITY_DN16730_c0_g1_i1.p1 TRINITY_DN16730_c0_g1~~TRINITY_DN16730_c0_g1_i1.p1  ORF type:complete len:768 (-),score=260.91 TRINITY_DN16730_c0_g1_i1:25-2304(-)